MARSKKKKKQQQEAKEDEGNASDASEDFQSERVADTTTTTDDSMWETIENLKEKRTSVRVAALSSIRTTLQHYQSVDLISKGADTLLTYASSLVKKASSGEEAQLACEVIALVALTLQAEGHDGHALLLKQWPTMQTLMKNTSRPLEARCAAVTAIGIMSWVDLMCETLEDEQLDPIITQFRLLCEPAVPPELVVAALDMLSLLFTCSTEAKLAGSLFLEYVPLCSTLLSHPTLAVKQAAGCLLALLQEAVMMCEQADVIGDVDEEVDMNSIIERLDDLAKDSSRTQTKKTRAKQKSFFRDILRTMEDAEQPTEKLEIMTVTHEFKGWRMLLRLKSVRALLGSGLTQQLVKNDMLVDVFNVDVPNPDDEESMTPAQKKSNRKARQTHSKDQYHTRDKQRKKKMQIRNAHDED